MPVECSTRRTTEGFASAVLRAEAVRMEQSKFNVWERDSNQRGLSLLRGPHRQSLGDRYVSAQPTRLSQIRSRLYLRHKAKTAHFIFLSIDESGTGHILACMDSYPILFLSTMQYTLASMPDPTTPCADVIPPTISTLSITAMKTCETETTKSTRETMQLDYNSKTNS